MGTTAEVHPPVETNRPLPLGDLPETVEAFLVGTWTGSSSGFTHNSPAETAEESDPLSVDRPPELAAFFHDGTAYAETSGYTLASSVICLRFDGHGKLFGKVKVNRGGSKIIRNDDVTGTYTATWNSTLNVVEGFFTTLYKSPGNPTITIQYYYVASDSNQLDWIRLKSEKEALPVPFRGTVAHGTLRRADYGAMRSLNPERSPV